MSSGGPLQPTWLRDPKNNHDNLGQYTLLWYIQTYVPYWKCMVYKKLMIFVQSILSNTDAGF